MNLTNTMLSGRSQTQKHIYCVIPFIECKAQKQVKLIYTTGSENDDYPSELEGMPVMFCFLTWLLFTQGKFTL